jgi:3-oxoacyl-[acyl-carrier protein] reductase
MQSETRHAVITGGTGALGRAITDVLKASNWCVLAPGRDELDVRDQPAVRKFFQSRQVDLLVCAAGITRDAPIARLTHEAWDDTWSVNFRGALACANAALPGMIAGGGGHIVFIASHSARQPPVGQAAYATAKAALLGLAADLARRHGAANIRVNAILPGFLQTRMTETVTDARRAEILAAHALGRFNTCERVAAFIRFLHHELPHTSGQIFQLDSR